MKEFDLYSVSTLVMICSRKGYILYDRSKDKNKRPRRESSPTRQKSNTRVHYSTEMRKVKSKEIEKREEWLSDSIRRAQRRLGIRTQQEYAGQMGMTRSTLQTRLKDPSTMSLGELWRVEAVFRHAGMNDEADSIRFAFNNAARRGAA